MVRVTAIFAGLLLGALLAAPASANTIARFALSGGFLLPDPNDSTKLVLDGTATGTFRIDLTTNSVVDSAITTTTGVLLPGASYPGFSTDTYTPSLTGAELVLRTSASAVPGIAGQFLTIDFPDNPGLFSVGHSFFVSGNESISVFFCGGICITRPLTGLIQLTSLTTVTTPTTPIPATLPLLATALGGMGILGWRRKRVAAPMQTAV